MVIVITGASRGIGEALALRLMSAGATLFLISRSEDALRRLSDEGRKRGCKVMYRAVDLRDRKALDALCCELQELFPSVDYFFCNAGKSIHRSVSDAQERLHDYDRTMDVNYRSLVALSLALLPALRKAKGQIIYSSTVSTLYPAAPGWSAYHASKSAANVWCETADAELSKDGIRVKIAYLPLVHTAMSDVNETYRKMPAMSASSAAKVLVNLSRSRCSTYKPWWVRLSEPLAWLFSPLIRFVYKHFC